ncbi:uncharacterized protein [Montipora capricornis]|uniref:uncharacterized protein n=1 Tax=Montipora foliosa TaxID=591990 RepID=UPI0035F135ED
MTETAVDEVQHERIPRRRKRRFESDFFYYESKALLWEFEEHLPRNLWNIHRRGCIWETTRKELRTRSKRMENSSSNSSFVGPEDICHYCHQTTRPSALSCNYTDDKRGEIYFLCEKSTCPDLETIRWTKSKLHSHNGQSPRSSIN